MNDVELIVSWHGNSWRQDYHPKPAPPVVRLLDRDAYTLTALQVGPATITDLMATLSGSRSAVNDSVRRLVQAELVTVVGMRWPKEGRAAAVYAASEAI